jgi:hypothetical protein
VVFDHAEGRVSITFRPTGIASLSEPEAIDPVDEPDLREVAA